MITEAFFVATTQASSLSAAPRRRKSSAATEKFGLRTIVVSKPAEQIVTERPDCQLTVCRAHRWSRDDQHPSGRQSGVAFLNALREGPPWPSHDAV